MGCLTIRCIITMSKMSGTVLLYIFEIHIILSVCRIIPYDGGKFTIPLDVRVKEQK